VFAWVIAIGLMLGGGLAIYNLPVSQYRRSRRVDRDPHLVPGRLG